MSASAASIDRLAKLLHQSPDAALSKSQMDHLILEKVGMSVSDELLSAIFRACDEDRSGTVSIKELAGFVDSIRPPTRAERFFYVVKQAVTSITVLTLAMFISATGTGFVRNVRALLDSPGRDNINYGGMGSMMFVIGCYVFVEFAREDVAQELRLMEACKDKIVAFSKKIDSVNTVADEEAGDEAGKGGLDRDLEMTPKELFELFQKDGLFLPYEIFERIFEEIDVDGSGLLSFSEVKAYAEAREERGKLSAVMFQVVVFKNCLLSLAYWVGWGWVIACLFWTIAAYARNISDKAVLHLNGVASAMCFFCATFQHYIQYQDVSKHIAWAEKLEHAFLFLVAQMEAKAKNDVETGKGAQKSITTSDAVRQLFDDLDVQGGDNEDGGDGALDFIELHDALTRAGFVVELGVLRELFLHADVNGDGRLQAEEFVEWISDLQTGHSAGERRIHILTTMVRSVRFWMACLQMLGSIALVAGSYTTSARDAKIWYMLSSCCWFIPGCKNLGSAIVSIGHSFDSLANSKLAFKKALQA